MSRPVVHTPGVCGGSARLDGTRIPVWTLEALRVSGASAAEVVRAFPVLVPEDVEGAWAWAAEHREEVERDCRENDWTTPEGT